MSLVVIPAMCPVPDTRVGIVRWPSVSRPRGLVVHSFANDDWKDCREYVHSKLGLSKDWKSDKAPPDMTGDDMERRKKVALKIWADCVDPRGTLAERYLREHRKLELA